MHEPSEMPLDLRLGGAAFRESVDAPPFRPRYQSVAFSVVLVMTLPTVPVVITAIVVIVTMMTMTVTRVVIDTASGYGDESCKGECRNVL